MSSREVEQRRFERATMTRPIAQLRGEHARALRRSLTGETFGRRRQCQRIFNLFL
jgi:hypothetical protein